jgi:O-antigen biosynthesis protein
MLDLGYKTSHTIFRDYIFDYAEAMFDTPIYADYQFLDHRYPGSKFILTWRNPEKWHASFQKNLLHYLNTLRTVDIYTATDRDVIRLTNWRCYAQVFGLYNLESKDFLLSRYHEHREYAEYYFRNRQDDFLVLDLDSSDDQWQMLCDFLGKPHPGTDFHHLNAARVQVWDHLEHPLKIGPFAPLEKLKKMAKG